MAANNNALLQLPIGDLFSRFVSAAPHEIQALEAAITSTASTAQGVASAIVDIILNNAAPASVKQFAAVVLRRQVVDKRWGGNCEDSSTLLSPQEMADVRARLPSALADSSPRVRKSVATVVAEIGSLDWPEQWPQLFDELLACINGTAAEHASAEIKHFLLDGALHCLTYFIGEHIDQEHSINASRVLVPAIMRLLEQSGTNCSTGINNTQRAQCFKILESCISSLHLPSTVSEENQKRVTTILDELLRPLCQLCIHELSSPLVAGNGAKVKQCAICCIQAYLTHYPKRLEPIAGPVVAELFRFVSRIVPTYVRVVVNGGEFTQEESGGVGEAYQGIEDGYDSDGEERGLAPLVMQLLSLLCAIVGSASRKIRKLLKAHVADTVYGILPMIQIPTETMAEWECDQDLFIAQEESEGLDVSVRQMALDLIAEMFDSYKTNALSAIVEGLDRGVGLSSLISMASKGDQLTTGNNAAQGARAWKMHECSLLVLGTIAPSLAHLYANATESKRDTQARKQPAAPPVHIPAVLQLLQRIVATGGQCLPIDASSASFVSPAATSDAGRIQLHNEDNSLAQGSIFIVGRALWCAARLARAVDVDTAKSFTSAAIQGLGTDQPLPVRVAACQALVRFVRRLSKISPDLIKSHMPTAIERTAELVIQSSQGALPLVLETLSVCIKCAPIAAAAQENRLTPLLLALWIKHVNDPMLGPASSDCLGTLINNPDPGVAQAVARRLLPVVTPVLRQYAAESSASHSANSEYPEGESETGATRSMGAGVTESALELLRAVVSHAPRPLPEELLQPLPTVLEFALSCSDDDSAALQSSCDVLAAFVSAAPQQISNWSDPARNITGPGLILRVLAKVLGPGPSDAAVLYSGKLVTACVTHFAPVLGAEMLRELLVAVVRRLASAKMPSLVQALVMVFAGLLAQEADAVLELLLNVQVECVQRDNVLSAIIRDEGLTSTNGSNTQTSGATSGLLALLQTWTAYATFFNGEWARKLSALGLANLLSSSRVMEHIQHASVRGTEIPSEARTRSETKAQPKQYKSIPLAVKMCNIILHSLMEFSEEENEDENSWQYEDEDDEDGDDERDAIQTAGESPFVDADDLVYLSDMINGGNLVDLAGGGAIFGAANAFADADELDDGDDVDQEDDDELALWQAHPWYKLNCTQKLRIFVRQTMHNNNAPGIPEGQIHELNDICSSPRHLAELLGNTMRSAAAEIPQQELTKIEKIVS